nr:MAG TPA: hypothetical protein [Microviridae sp.]
MTQAKQVQSRIRQCYQEGRVKKINFPLLFKNAVRT